VAYIFKYFLRTIYIHPKQQLPGWKVDIVQSCGLNSNERIK